MHEQIPVPSGYDVYWEKWIDAYSPEETEIVLLDEESFEEDHGISFEEELGTEFKNS